MEIDELVKAVQTLNAEDAFRVRLTLDNWRTIAPYLARYDIRAVSRRGVPTPEDFDPVALRGFVNRVFAVRFNLEIYVNQQCQHPCGPRALEASDATR